MAYIVGEPCVGVCDTACVEVCPVDCFYPAEGHSFESEEGKAAMRSANEMLYIHPEECIDCGACEPECPVEAIYPEDDVPDDQKSFIKKNYERFGM